MRTNFKRVNNKLSKNLTNDLWDLVENQLLHKVWKTPLDQLYFSVREQIWYRTGEPISQVRNRHED